MGILPFKAGDTVLTLFLQQDLIEISVNGGKPQELLINDVLDHVMFPLPVVSKINRDLLFPTSFRIQQVIIEDGGRVIYTTTDVYFNTPKLN